THVAPAHPHARRGARRLLQLVLRRAHGAIRLDERGVLHRYGATNADPSRCLTAELLLPVAVQRIPLPVGVPSRLLVGSAWQVGTGGVGWIACGRDAGGRGLPRAGPARRSVGGRTRPEAGGRRGVLSPRSCPPRVRLLLVRAHR